MKTTARREAADVQPAAIAAIIARGEMTGSQDTPPQRTTSLSQTREMSRGLPQDPAVALAELALTQAFATDKDASSLTGLSADEATLATV